MSSSIASLVAHEEKFPAQDYWHKKTLSMLAAMYQSLRFKLNV